ncbi:hypothetical protein EJ08DRAFT_693479 [Tothia fuscella]|uniref:Uncharacterized protein n=1 Tax=Tothia fuscella TaxID=1048955 RepID=A0A9P4NXW7_9PEZI|nr:hypothetical protein EJ08DRAFT_693479 [Tothia fuscella]
MTIICSKIRTLYEPWQWEQISQVSAFTAILQAVLRHTTNWDWSTRSLDIESIAAFLMEGVKSQMISVNVIAWPGLADGGMYGGLFHFVRMSHEYPVREGLLLPSNDTYVRETVTFVGDVPDIPPFAWVDAHLGRVAIGGARRWLRHGIKYKRS